jgi:hypothetical protein
MIEKTMSRVAGRKIIWLVLISGLFLLPLTAKGQQSSDLLKEYLFPIQYGINAAQNDVIGLRIYRNPDNQDPLSWYLHNVSNPKDNLPAIKADGYVAVRDDRSVYIQAANLTPLTGTPVFYTNIYVLAYNQNASPETINIFNQMLANIKFNKNIMDLYCLKTQFEAVKDSLRRDTIRKADLYKLKNIFANASGLNLQAGTYVPNMSISTWPSWQATLGKQLGTALPVDPLNVMADRLILCTKNEDCATRQCSGGYCSACNIGWDARTCWNERTLNYQSVDGFVYKYQSGVLTIRYEYPQIIFPASTSCFLGCNDKGAYYALGSCLATNQYCAATGWADNFCGDGFVRCNEVCEGANCAPGCLSCQDNYHAVGSLCEYDTNPVTSLTQTLSEEEKTRWTGDGWSTPYATACVTNAVLDSKGACHCKTNYHESSGSCLPNSRLFSCNPKPEVGAVWNTVEGYQQDWDGEKWVPLDSATVYDVTAVDDACHFKCAQNYDWILNSETKKYECKATGQLKACGDKPDHTVWNNVGNGSFLQIWNGSAWLPATMTPAFNNEATSDNTCNFKCDTNYSWNDPNCTPGSNTFECSGNPDNSNFYNDSYTQVWDGSAWIPADSAAFFSLDPLLTGDPRDCRYKCKFNYTWDGSSICNADTRLAICIGKPDNSDWTGASTYTQTWSGTAWLPEIIPSFDETDITACHYKCSANFVWDVSECKSIADCGDGIITPNSTEICDDGDPPTGHGGHNGQFGYCNSTCSGIEGMGTPLFYDNFENVAFTSDNWQQGFCPTGTLDCSWPIEIFPLGFNNHSLKSIGGSNTAGYARDIWVQKTDLNALVNVDILVMVTFLAGDSHRDAMIIARRTGDSSSWTSTNKGTESYYSLFTNSGYSTLILPPLTPGLGTDLSSPNTIRRINSGTMSGILAFGPSETVAAGEYWLRLQIHNDDSPKVVIKSMWWPVGDPMPATWQIDYTDLSGGILTGGNVGLAGWKDATFYFDNFQVYAYTP